MQWKELEEEVLRQEEEVVVCVKEVEELLVVWVKEVEEPLEQEKKLEVVELK